MKVRKGDKVFIISGKDKGKNGTISKVFPKDGLAVVDGINLVKKAMKSSQKNPKGGFIEKPAPLAVANIQVICPSCGKSARLGYKTLKDGSKERICKKCDQAIKE